MTRHALLATTALVGYANDTTAGTEVNTPLGRIVFGNPFRAQDKMKDGQKVIGKDGQPVKVISFGVAFPKGGEFDTVAWPAMVAEASKLFGGTVPQGFKYKMRDGDSPEAPFYNGKSGVPYNQREGYPGHWVLSISTELPAVSVMKFHNGAYHQVGANEIKTGDYVQMTLNLKAHLGQTPGLYINPVLVLLCYSGPAIASSFEADPTQKFGAAPNIAPPPPGATALGEAPQAGGMPGMPGGAPQPGMGQPQGMPQQGYQQPGQQMPQGMPGQQMPQGMPGQQMPQGMPGQQMPQGMPGQQMPGNGAAATGYPQAGSPAPGNGYPPPATDFIPGGQPQGYQQQMPQQGMPGQPMMQPGQMPGMPGPR